MQIKIFTIPILGGERINEEVNAFLRSKRVLHVDNQMVNHEGSAFWCFCIKYLDTDVPQAKKKKVDYKDVLDEESFRRFTEMRQIRKRISQDEGIPAYAVFTDEEMAGLAKLAQLTPTTMRSVKGIGIKKVEKFGTHFFTKKEDEKSQ